ncbi:MAG: hypothetical protein EOP49_12580 [Sphingobacteriales bacterium]|nr:MAG: hypothetical protein EOP49_12580 [Sphingobacteriales bacterium]
MQTIKHNTGAPQGDTTAMLCREEDALGNYLSQVFVPNFEESFAPTNRTATPAESPVAAVTLTDYQRSQPIMALDEEDDVDDDDDTEDLDIDDEELDDADLDEEELDADDLDDEDLDLDEDEDEEEDDIV